MLLMTVKCANEDYVIKELWKRAIYNHALIGSFENLGLQNVALFTVMNIYYT